MYRLGPTTPADPAAPHRAESAALTPPAAGADESALQRPGRLGPVAGVEDEVRLDGIRVKLVLRVRQEIAAGVYETPAKLHEALGRLVDSLEAD
jgi:hypothetical protein